MKGGEGEGRTTSWPGKNIQKGRSDEGTEKQGEDAPWDALGAVVAIICTATNVRQLPPRETCLLLLVLRDISRFSFLRS